MKKIIWNHPSSTITGPGRSCFIEPSLIIINVCLVCMIHAQEFGRRYVEKYTSFSLLSSKLSFNLGIMKCTISFLLNLKMIHTKFVKAWPWSSREDVNAQCRTEDDWHQHIHVWLGWHKCGKMSHNSNSGCVWA